jgi:hypothetical protein
MLFRSAIFLNKARHFATKFDETQRFSIFFNHFEQDVTLATPKLMAARISGFWDAFRCSSSTG